jgi:hypothetical protein
MLAIAVLPLSLVFNQESRAAKASFYRAAALELVDGEMEILAAGEWRAYSPGTHPYSIRATAATNLPPGEFKLLLRDRTLRLEWLPKRRGSGGSVAREVTLP